MLETLNHKLLIFLLLIMIVGGFYLVGPAHYLSWEQLQSRQQELQVLANEHPLKSSMFFLLIYTAVTFLSIPIATLLTLTGAAVFGFWWSVVLVSFGSSLGATGCMLCSRYLFRSWVENRFSGRIGAFKKGLERDGSYYLLFVRLLPIIPFFLVNLVVGVLRFSAWRFYWVGQIGMLPATMLYANLGVEIGIAESLPDIWNLAIFRILLLMSILPLAARKFLQRYEA
jgi:uncharacterized membrane protein YdjX (TVP38/TMEM64 family)